MYIKKHLEQGVVYLNHLSKASFFGKSLFIEVIRIVFHFLEVS